MATADIYPDRTQVAVKPRRLARRAPRWAVISFPVVAGVVRVMDFVVLCIAGEASTMLTYWAQGSHPQGLVALTSIAGALGMSFAMARCGAYDRSALVKVGTQVRMVAKSLLAGLFCMLLALFLFQQGELPLRMWPLAWSAAAFALVAASRLPLTRLLRYWTETGRLTRTVAIVGMSEFSHAFIERLRADPGQYRVVGIFDDRLSRVPPSQSGIEVRGTVMDLVDRSRQERVDVIVIALPLSAVDRIKAIMDKLNSTIADIVLTTDVLGLQYSPPQFNGIGRNPVVLVREAPLKDWRAVEKLLVDYSVGIIALIVLSPLLLLTALLIKLDSPGPVLFRQPRMGLNNRLFLCYKFRSMQHGKADLMANQQTTRNDPRITRVGRLIRKLSIDELPQILNVLNGTMSLVGPRPHAPHTKAADQLFAEVVQQYAARHRVKPGITGWAQVNGWRGETTTVEQIEERVKCDLAYIENWSVRFDIKIMMMTLLREVRSQHAF